VDERRTIDGTYDGYFDFQQILQKVLAFLVNAVPILRIDLVSPGDIQLSEKFIAASGENDDAIVRVATDAIKRVAELRMDTAG
jgi:hypothetical protein